MQPIACSLDAADRSARMDEIGALLLELESGHAELRFPLDAPRERLSAVVAAETECCPFLDLSLAERDEALILTIIFPSGVAPAS